MVPHLNLFDERYPGEKVTIQLKNGEEYTLNIDKHKGRLIIEKLKNFTSTNG
ncbi:hypothetical protein ACNNMU_09895 [Aerococcus viridans]